MRLRGSVYNRCVSSRSRKPAFQSTLGLIAVAILLLLLTLARYWKLLHYRH